MTMKLGLPVIVALFAVFSEYSGLDLALARFFYDPETGAWPLKSNFWTAVVLHKAAKGAVVLFCVGVLALFLLSFAVGKLRRYRKGAGYFLAGSLLGPAIVVILKGATHIYTPWSLALFGGDKPYLRLFDAVPPGLPVGQAFPGGHSSAGFAFLSLYFLFSHYRPQWKYYGLAFGLVLGGVFSATQMARGAHFLSHDLFSLVICWYAALAVDWLMFRPLRPNVSRS